MHIWSYIYIIPWGSRWTPCRRGRSEWGTARTRCREWRRRCCQRWRPENRKKTRVSISMQMRCKVNPRRPRRRRQALPRHHRRRRRRHRRRRQALHRHHPELRRWNAALCAQLVLCEYMISGIKKKRCCQWEGFIQEIPVIVIITNLPAPQAAPCPPPALLTKNTHPHPPKIINMGNNTDIFVPIRIRIRWWAWRGRSWSRWRPENGINRSG